VVVIRSLTWSPFCRAQVDAWARRIADAREIGYEVVVVSARASEGAGGMPLLVAGDEVLGLRNPLIERGEEGFGTLTPATFVLSPDGRVEHRFVDKHHARRVTPGTVLAALAPPNAAMSAPVAGQGLRASATLLDPALWLEAQSTLLVRLELDPGRYIYTDPLPDGFIATTVQVLPTEGLRLSRIAYPPAESKEFPDLGVTLPIYEGVADFLVPVRATSELLGFEVERPTNGYPLFVRVDYQTCSSNFCFSPQTLELYVEVSAQALQP
ncbi:MAG: protein-disulfide reductase DsbD domain-containing protein, partial [Acidobacteriota bacterium]